MIWEGYRLVPVKKIGLPGDIAKRQKQPHVKELAESIRQLGQEPIQAPTIDGSTFKLIAGRDRMAAVLLLKLRSVWCHIAVQVADQDALDLEVDENLHRRQDNRDELIARRVRKVARQLPDKMSGKSGRPKSGQGAAREQVARELGTTPEAVRAAVKRAEHVHRFVAVEDDGDGVTEACECGTTRSPAALAPPVTTWGVPVEHLAQEFAAIRIAQEALREADRHLRAAQRAITALNGGAAICATLYTRTYSAVHDAAEVARRAMPEALCPYCKGLAHRRAKCSGCRGLGYVGPDELFGIAPELTNTDGDAMVTNGRGGFELLSAATAPRAPMQPQSKTRKLQVQDEHGNPIALPPVDEDEDAPF